MKLVKLQENKKRHVYVNPEKVQVIRPVNDHASMIHFEGYVLTVQHEMEELIRLLNKEDIF